MTIAVRHRLQRMLLVAAVSASLWLALVVPAVAAEAIDSFHADITIQPDGALLITETIRYDFDSANRHGIYRTITGNHANKASAWYLDRYIDIELLNVLRNGRTEQYRAESGEALNVRIGDPDVTISGQQTYEITYLVEGAMATFAGEDELYWNLTGNEWDVPMKSVVATVRGEGVRFDGRSACYVGVVGSNEACSVTVLGEFVTQFSASEVLPGEQVTIAQGVAFSGQLTPLERMRWWIILPFVYVFMVVVIAISLYRWRTAHKLHRAVVAQYEPYEDFRPMFTGVLFDGRLDSKDITAGLVTLAQEGFIHIKQTSRKVLFAFTVHDYEVTLRRSVSEVTTAFQRQLLELLFMGQLGTDADSRSESDFYIGKTVQLSEIKKNQSKLKKNSKIIKKLKKAIEQDLLTRAFFERPAKKLQSVLIGFVVLFVTILAIAGGLFGSLTDQYKDAIVFLSFALFGPAVIAVVLMHQRRTKKGYEARNHLEGFKDFLSTTEAERYKFHNAPAKSPEQFMQYLPYAIAFGVEKEWAAVFADIVIDAPAWYQSETGTHFNAVTLGNELSAFSSSLSSSAGTSGASGSGSAGGGSGGGGGGSW